MSLFVWKLNLGIDFTGGSLASYSLEAGESNEKSEEPIERGRELIKKTYVEFTTAEPVVQNELNSDRVGFLVKSKSITPEQRSSIVRRLDEGDIRLTEKSFESIDPQVGKDVTRKAIWAVAIASIAIIIYIAISFRGIPKPASSVQFGVFAVIALLHDVLFIIGFYSLMGHFYGWEVNAEFVTATLTVMGFSVHDTIVVFDRLRENLRFGDRTTFTSAANTSLAQTIARSLNTSLTVILVLFAIVLLGGTTIRAFATTLLVGITVGTFSSIFVATPLLTWWQDLSQNRKSFKTRSKRKIKFPAFFGRKSRV